MPSPTTPFSANAPLVHLTGMAQDSQHNASSGDGFNQALGQARSRTTSADHDADTARDNGSSHTEAASRAPDQANAKPGRGKQQHVDGHAADKQHAHGKAHHDKNKDTAAVPVLQIIEAAQRQPAAARTGKPLPLIDGKPTAATSKVAQAIRGATRDTSAIATALGDGSTQKAHAAKTDIGTFEKLTAAAADTTSTPHGSKPDAANGAASGLSALMATPQPPQTSTPAPVHQLQITVPPQSPDFAQALSQHVVWLAGQSVQQAKIQLHPRDLGPLQVNVQVHHDHVDVSFAVQHPDTVHALQQTLPQLDAQLAQHGLSLGQAHVGQQHAGGGQHDGSSGNPNGNGSDPSTTGDAVTASATAATQVAVGLVDAFA